MAKDRLQHCPLVVGLSDRIFSKTYNISLPKVAEWKSKVQVLQDGAEDILPLIILNFDNVFFLIFTAKIYWFQIWVISL